MSDLTLDYCKACKFMDINYRDEANEESIGRLS